MVGGVLLSLAQAPSGWTPLAYLAPAFLFSAVYGQPPKVAGIAGAAFGLAFFGLSGIWMLGLGAYSPMIPAAYVVLVLIWSAIAGGFGAWAGAIGILYPTWGLILLPIGWAAMEVVRIRLPVIGIGWGLLAHTQIGVPPMLRLAALAGPVVVSMAAAAIPAALVAARMRLWKVAAALAAVIALMFGGGVLAGDLQGDSPRDPASIAIVQTALDPTEKWDEGKREEILQELGSLTRQASAPLVVWPESAVAGPLLMDPAVRRWVGDLARSTGKWILAGSLEPVSERRWRTLAVLLDSAGAVRGWYVKRAGIPAGERGLMVGDRPGILDTPVGRIGVLICYDLTRAGIAQDLVSGGAEIIVVQSNTGYLRGGAGAAQYRRLMPLVAATTGRPVLWATNGGRSGAWDAGGREIVAARPDRAVTLNVRVSPSGAAAAGVFVEAPFHGLALLASAVPVIFRKERFGEQGSGHSCSGGILGGKTDETDWR